MVPKSKNVYLASANSYNGFISYFNSIFRSNDFKKIFVLKGGPGTGKSSLMKKIAATLEGDEVNCELFYCSSDPKSLDGIILENNKGKICILDGTAPHERDAIIPGAIDELIALSEAFDIKALEDRKESIVKLNEEKNAAYKKAYEYLQVSSVFDKYIEAERLKCFNDEAASNIIRKEFKYLINCKKGKSDVRLISYFSKYGYGSFDTLEKIATQVISIDGDEILSGKLLERLANFLNMNSVSYRRFPSPLQPDRTEAIYIKDLSCAFVINRDADEKINPESYIYTGISSSDVSDYEKQKTEYLNKAAKSLSLASQYHFELEDIYTSAMDFSIVDDICEKITVKIKNVLSL